jgi:hypothetical protein
MGHYVRSMAPQHYESLHLPKRWARLFLLPLILVSIGAAEADDVNNRDALRESIEAAWPKLDFGPSLEVAMGGLDDFGTGPVGPKHEQISWFFSCLGSRGHLFVSDATQKLILAEEIGCIWEAGTEDFNGDGSNEFVILASYSGTGTQRRYRSIYLSDGDSLKGPYSYLQDSYDTVTWAEDIELDDGTFVTVFEHNAETPLRVGTDVKITRRQWYSVDFGSDETNRELDSDVLLAIQQEFDIAADRTVSFVSQWWRWNTLTSGYEIEVLRTAPEPAFLRSECETETIGRAVFVRCDDTE